LGIGAAAAAATLIPAKARAATSRPVAKAPERALSFFNTHTGERLKTTYCSGGCYRPEALQELNHIMRDFRVNEIKPIDPRVFDLLHELGGTLETHHPFHTISGYRSPKTNPLLRDR